MSSLAAQGCALDDRGVVSLDKILQSFDSPISEEQAWALCYALSECYVRLSGDDKVAIVAKLKHVILHKDGFVHQETFLPTGERAKGRSRASSEGKVVTELGVLLYRALDYSLGKNEERNLSQPLDRLIDLMTSSETEKGETDDEGIEQDSEDESAHNGGASFTMRDAFNTCQERLCAEGSTICIADDHYRAVVRALVAEALDLTSFLMKVREGSKFVGSKNDFYSSEKEIHSLQCEDWLRLWIQVMQQLRDGVHLKKREYTRTPLEYALTPYEMLMEDIRARRYTLNKVTTNSDIQNRVKKDAHSIILEFIRSRPPLRKASDRKLNPLRKVSTPMELLMDSLKTNNTLRLRHVDTPTSRSRPVSMIESNRSFSSPHMGYVAPQRKLISAPRFDPSFDDDDDDDLSDIPPSSPQLPVSLSTHTHASLHGSPTSSNEFTPNGSPGRKYGTRSPITRTAYDLVKYSNNGITERRHSISICETPLDASRRGSLDRQSSTTSTCSNRTSVSCASPSAQGNFYESSSRMQRDFLKSSHFSHRLDCLSLTLEEVVHIRNVLTKAELEALPLDKSIKEDMTRGKICFLCMKTRFGFGFFSQRGRECRLCKRIVCKKCIAKMRIPTEHFSTIPVVMLTPSAISPRDEEESSLIPRSFLNMLQDIPRPGSSSAERNSSVSGSVGSAPSSPKSSRSREGPSSLPTPPAPAPCVASDIKKKQELRQRQQEMESRLRGELMCVCLDCKAMVIHVLYSIKLRRDYTHSPSCANSAATTNDRSCCGKNELLDVCTNSSELRNHLHLELTSVYD